MSVTKELVLEILHPIQDPDLMVSIVDLGLIHEVFIDGDAVKVNMILTSPGCPHGPMMLSMAERKLNLDDRIGKAKVDLVMGKTLTLEDLSDEQKLMLGIDI